VSGAEGTLLRATSLVKSLGGRRVVDQVSLEVRSSEVVGLLGPNGAGKSTVFNLIFGMIQPDEGQVELCRPGAGEPEEITALPPYRRALAGIGYLPQGPSVFSGLTVAQNLEAVLQLRQGPSPAGRARGDELLEAFGLTALAEQRASTLSGGERRRLELAKLVAGRPGVLLLDEPLAGLDPLAVADFLRLLEGLRGEGMAILLTDHSVHQALTICTRAYILVDGSVLVSGSNREVTEHDAARRLFWGAGQTAAQNGSERREAHGT